MRFPKPKIGCGLAVLFSGSLWGQAEFTLKDAMAQTVAAHPLLAGAEQRVEAAAGLRRQASLGLNPRLNVQTENWRAWERGREPFVLFNSLDHFTFLQQTFETAGRRQKRTELADSVVERTKLERELLRRQILYRVRQGYWAASGAQRLVEILEENRKTFQQIVDYHELRVKEGAMAEADLLRVQLEASRLALAQNAAQLEAEKLRVMLFREMALTEFPAVHFKDAPDQSADVLPAGDLPSALGERMELRIAREALETARRNLLLQQAGAKPNIDALFGYKRTGGLDTLLTGVQMDLAVRNKNEGNIDAAAAEIRLAESGVRAAEAVIRAEVVAAQADVGLRRQQLSEVLKKLQTQSAETSRIAVAAYREGGADLLRLLDAERLRLEVAQLSIRAWTEYRQSVVQLEAALGVQP